MKKNEICYQWFNISSTLSVYFESTKSYKQPTSKNCFKTNIIVYHLTFVSSTTVLEKFLAQYSNEPIMTHHAF